MTKKFTSGPGHKRLNSVIDDVSLLNDKPQRNRHTQTFGVVRCFLLTDTSSEPMTATGVMWDGSAWVESGLGTSVEVYPNPNYTNSDYQDDMYIFARNFGGRWVSIDPATAGGGSIRNAYCQEDAPEVANITAFLDTDATGEQVEVYCTICDGTALNAAVPRLSDGDLIPVYYDGTKWRCCTVFQASEDCS